MDSKYSFNGCCPGWRSSTDPLIQQFALHYGVYIQERLSKAEPWIMSRRIDTEWFVLRLEDIIYGVDEDRCTFESESFKVYYDRKIGHMDLSLKEEIKVISEKSPLNPEYLDEWLHIWGEFGYSYFENVKGRLVGIHVLVDEYMREEKHLRRG